MSFLIFLATLSFMGVSNGATIRSQPGVVSYEVPIPRTQTRQEYIRSAIDFWTPERIASARSLEPTMSPNYQIPFTNNQDDEVDTTEQILTPSAPPKSKAPVGPPAAGKVFFSFGGLNYMCSGSIVNADNHDSVVTAGHCVYNNTAKVFATNFVFIPHYENKVRPFGTFPARIIVTTDTWMAKTDYNFDVAVVTVHTNEDGDHVQDLTGAFGISLNAPEVASTVLFGYPANSQNGEIMATCNGQTGKPSALVSLLSNNFKGIQITCGMNGGSSGGPWVRNYNSNTGSALQVGVTSFGSSLAAGKIHAPRFNGDNIGSIFSYAKNK